MTGKEIELETAEWFINLVGTFEHYSFFTKEEWRKIKGFKNADKAEVHAAFLHWWFHNKTDYYTCPVGMSWFSEVSRETYENYIKQNEPLFKAYSNWINKQR